MGDSTAPTGSGTRRFPPGRLPRGRAARCPAGAGSSSRAGGRRRPRRTPQTSSGQTPPTISVAPSQSMLTSRLTSGSRSVRPNTRKAATTTGSGQAWDGAAASRSPTRRLVAARPARPSDARHRAAAVSGPCRRLGTPTVFGIADARFAVVASRAGSVPKAHAIVVVEAQGWSGWPGRVIGVGVPARFSRVPPRTRRPDPRRRSRCTTGCRHSRHRASGVRRPVQVEVVLLAAGSGLACARSFERTPAAGEASGCRENGSAATWATGGAAIEVPHRPS
ncbi:hypothetical protein FHR81_001443 [Actinoalloteichus hoggarensis]|uniref:Uncharacterized protein n=1 Tax=Actinoalloteichus hoggarensis TaxID=1470176 RepID=A0A221W079_9PSEU|nr:hypothetical protein AHOG_07660 [Actinoalloteichus hoggarensis]MBB5920413.1 hypothetical protein [Actinoalloteichus hoggarensis]